MLKLLVPQVVNILPTNIPYHVPHHVYTAEIGLVSPTRPAQAAAMHMQLALCACMSHAWQSSLGSDPLGSPS